MLLDNTVNIYVIHSHYAWFHIYKSQYKTKLICMEKSELQFDGAQFEEGTKEELQRKFLGYWE